MLVRMAKQALVLGLILGAAHIASAASSSRPPAPPDQSIAGGLGLPIACVIGKTCWVANYLDLDATDRVSDWRCRGRSYHDGVDFAIRDLAVMAQGVPVLAVAPGTVRNSRDGMADVGVTDEASRKRIAGRECGNGVIIDHEGNWQTQYCHLRMGSVLAKAGQKVQRGTPLGMVGFSGLTEFPHLHLTVSRNKSVMDPFTGKLMTAGCKVDRTPLWGKDQSVPYEEVALYNAGFSTEKPDLAAIRKGQREDAGSLPAIAPALILWVDMFGVEAGDRLTFRITGPDGKVIFEQEQPVEKRQARRFAFMGKKREANPWPAGTYNGQVTLTRKVDGKDKSFDVARTVTVH
jgi:murein DD-endopeptidase MepM/ murein hydrolase activator NlpD